MAMGFFLRVGDKTSCGGEILTGDPTFSWYGVPTARDGDAVSCGKHSGRFQICGGVQDVWDEGQMLAGTLDSISSCPCRATFINSIVDCYEKEEQTAVTDHVFTNTAATAVVPRVGEEANQKTAAQDLPCRHAIRFRCSDDHGHLQLNCRYILLFPQGHRETGITDAQGLTAWHFIESAEHTSLHLLKD